MIIKKMVAHEISDTRGDKTIEVELKTDFGKFIASSPNGKSRGKYEAQPWKKNISGDIKIINKYGLEKINKLKIEKFDDLKNIEKVFVKKIGANSMIAVEYTFLKALAAQQKKEVWQIINPSLDKKQKTSLKLPIPVGNAIGGGVHSKFKKNKLSFQEFHFIPESSNIKDAVEANKRARENCKEILKNEDKTFKEIENDENAWTTSFDEEQVMDIVIDVKENIIDEFSNIKKIHCGIDVAASEFFKNGKYNYNGKKLNSKEQIEYMIKIADNFFYIEDPLEQNDFKGFAEIRKKSKGLIVGDDLTATNLERIKKAVKMKSINAVIIKPNQNGSLIELKKIVEFCRKNKIKTVFSHRSGETEENILADLAFGFQADFIKTGICGKGRDEKLNRLVEIEERL